MCTTLGSCAWERVRGEAFWWTNRRGELEQRGALQGVRTAVHRVSDNGQMSDASAHPAGGGWQCRELPEEPAEDEAEDAATYQRGSRISSARAAPGTLQRPHVELLKLVLAEAGMHEA